MLQKQRHSITVSCESVGVTKGKSKMTGRDIAWEIHKGRKQIETIVSERVDSENL